MKFYRYTTIQYAALGIDGEYESPKFPNPKLICYEYNLHKETLKGHWIGYGHLGEGSLRSQSHWVSKTSKKRFAYPTKEEALINFEKRTESRIKILKKQLLTSEIALTRVSWERKNLKNVNKTES